MQMAMAVGGCSAEDADLLRRAMGSKRGEEKIDSLKEKLYAGMAENGIVGPDADAVYTKIQAFANFGFAESHSLSFALLVYVSAWLRLHYPGAFLAALLKAQPMGFYSPMTLVADARRHGVTVLRPDILRSGVDAVLEPREPDAVAGAAAPTGRASCLDRSQPVIGPFDRSLPDDTAAHRRDGAFDVRLGLAEVRGIGKALAAKIVAERDQHGDYLDQGDLARRVGFTTQQLESLSAAGAFDSLGVTRREALWGAAQASRQRPDQLTGTFVTVQPPLLPIPTAAEQVISDIWATGLSTDDHPIRHVRDELRHRGALRSDQLAQAEPDRRVEVGGIVTHRQRPATASGITFMNLEDEAGLVNVICSVGVWNRYRRVAREAPAMVVRGMLERSPEGIVNLVADRLEPLLIGAAVRSRDFQ